MFILMIIISVSNLKYKEDVKEQEFTRSISKMDVLAIPQVRTYSEAVMGLL